MLLRGVNVGGVAVRSPDLRLCLEQAGLESVRTVLASGNAVGSATLTPGGVRIAVENALRAHYEREVAVVVRSQQDLALIATASPFESDADTHHAYVIFVGDGSQASELMTRLQGAIDAGQGDPSAEGSECAGAPPVSERVVLGDGVVYWWCPKGSGLTTPVAKAVAAAARTILMTTRNLRTVHRLTSG